MTPMAPRIVTIAETVPMKTEEGKEEEADEDEIGAVQFWAAMVGIVLEA